MDLARDTVGVRDGDDLVALGLVYGEDQTFVRVMPSHRGRGIGAWLRGWSQDAGRAAGHAETTQTLSENEHAARALLEADGYDARHEGWILEIELEHEPDAPRVPPGYALRDFVPGADDRAAYRVFDEAFGEWRANAVGTFEDWQAETLGRPGFEPEQFALAVRGDEVVGAALLIDEAGELWVAQLAVAKPHRGLGLARALLSHAFGVAWGAGHRRVGLGTDSRTGALTLYEHVGMHVKRTFTEYGKRL